jgi:hypothetical protein
MSKIDKELRLFCFENSFELPEYREANIGDKFCVEISVFDKITGEIIVKRAPPGKNLEATKGQAARLMLNDLTIYRNGDAARGAAAGGGAVRLNIPVDSHSKSSIGTEEDSEDDDDSELFETHEPAVLTPAVGAHALQAPSLQAPSLQAPSLQAPSLQAPSLQAPSLQAPEELEEVRDHTEYVNLMSHFSMLVPFMISKYAKLDKQTCEVAFSKFTMSRHAVGSLCFFITTKDADTLYCFPNYRELQLPIDRMIGKYLWDFREDSKLQITVMELVFQETVRMGKPWSATTNILRVLPEAKYISDPGDRDSGLELVFKSGYGKSFKDETQTIFYPTQDEVITVKFDGMEEPIELGKQVHRADFRWSERSVDITAFRLIYDIKGRPLKMFEKLTFPE